MTLRKLDGAAVGLLGGTFDPIHAGHIALARAALRELNLTEIRFVPAANPWQKSGVSAAEDRLKMVELAIAGEPGCVLDRYEIAHAGANNRATYTSETLRGMRAALGAEVPIVLIIGSDQMRQLDTWHEWQALPTLAHLAVALRGQAVLTLSCELRAFYNEHWAPASALREQSAGFVFELPMTPVDVAATDVRSLLAQPESPARTARLSACLAPQVLDYIRAHHLYA